MTVLHPPEQAQRKPMMHVLNRTLSASLADPTRAFNGGSSRGFPADAVTLGSAALPSWVCLPAIEFRLPLGHTGVIAESHDPVEVTRRSVHYLSAPVAGSRYPVRPARVLPAHFRQLRARPRTEHPLAVARLECLTTNGAHLWRCNTVPSVTEAAGERTKLRVGPSIEGVKSTPALDAGNGYVRVPHTPMIPHIEIEEKYCRIAVERLRQAVLPLEPEPAPEQLELMP